MRCSRVVLTALALNLCITTIAASQIPIPPNISVTGSLSGLQNEEQVWICPNDTSIILTNHRDFRLGYRQIGLGRSTDGGATWVDTLIDTTYQIFTHQSDPVMTVNSSGDIIINHLDYRRGVSPRDSSHLAFMISTDCGATWSNPTTVVDTIGPYFEDKQFIASDRTGGIHDGNVYISWTRFDNPTRIIFARSTNNTASFDDTIVVGPAYTSSCFGGPSAAGQFSQPLVGKDGAVYIFWQGRHVDSLDAACDSYRAVRFNKSTDGGVTWQGDRALIYPIAGRTTVDGGVNTYSQPTTEADITDGPHAGNLYLQYRDINRDSPFFDSDIIFMRSLDTGATWSEPIRVNDDILGPDVDQFHNWLVTNEEGILVSIWYDQRTDPGHFKFDVFAAYSFDGGETWTSNHQISDVSIDPTVLAASKEKAYALEGFTPPPLPNGPMAPPTPMAGLIAEYIGVSCVDEKVLAIWTDTRLGGQDVMSATWQLPLTDPRLLSPGDGEVLLCGEDLVWATAWKEAEVSYRLQIDNDSSFSSPEIDTMLSDNLIGNASLIDLAAGSWYWRVQAFNVPIDSTLFSALSVFYSMGDCACDTLNNQDTDGDAIPDSCDNCPNVFNPSQSDSNSNGIGDSCEVICLATLTGDVNISGTLTAADIISLVSFVFKNGPAPLPCEASGDVNCTGTVTSADIIYMVGHIFKGASPPCDVCTLVPDTWSCE